MTINIGVELVEGGQIIHVIIRPRGVPSHIQESETMEFLYLGVGLGIGDDIGVEFNVGWSPFVTSYPIPITGFYFQPALIFEPFVAGLIFQLSLFSYFTLPLLMNDSSHFADISGLSYGLALRLLSTRAFSFQSGSPLLAVWSILASSILLHKQYLRD